MEYLPRSIDFQLDDLMSFEAAVAIDGPKGVGKTATASRRAQKIWRVDNPAERAVLEADPYFADAPDGTLLIDEWQHHPDVWNSVRRLVDDSAPAGRFLLTGSASPITGIGTHSGAGRIASARMRPMAFYERGYLEPTVSLKSLLEGTTVKISGSSPLTAASYFQAITKSGFPGIYGLTERQVQTRLDTYLQRIIDRDLPEAGLSLRKPLLLRRWMSAYAAASSTPTSYSNILDSTTSGEGTQPSRATTENYREHLAQIWLLDPLPAWEPSFGNPFKRQKYAPKHHLADPALAARLLGLTSKSLADRRGAPMAGPLLESLATLTVRVAAEAIGAKVGHLRTSSGDHEVDLVVEGFDGEVLALEVKLSAHVDNKDVRHLLWLRDQLPDQVNNVAVLYTGTEAYQRQDGVAVIPLSLLGL